MFESVTEATTLLEELVSRLDPACLSSADAVAGLDAFSRAGRLCAAGVALCAGRAEETRAHERDGARSAADWLARRTGQSVGEAIGALATARQAPSSGALDGALRAGELSGPQAAAVAEALEVNPRCGEELLDTARTDSLRNLRQKARAARSSAAGEEALVLAEEELRRRRYLRTYTDREGAVRGEFALAPLDGARLLSALEVEQREVFEAARRRGEHETAEAYAADALVALAERTAGDGRAVSTLVLTADIEAFNRGAAEPGETCEIAGVGPVAVSTARCLLGEAFLKLVIRDGVDVRSVTHLGRAIPAHLRTALELRDRHCVVPGCSETRLLEIDHWRIPFAAGGPTSLDNLARVCRAHHRKKTHRGFILDGGPGKWRWRPRHIFFPAGAVDESPAGASWPMPGQAPAGRAGYNADAGDAGGEPKPSVQAVELAFV
jgi:hypothetical protein